MGSLSVLGGVHMEQEVAASPYSPGAWPLALRLRRALDSIAAVLMHACQLDSSRRARAQPAAGDGRNAFVDSAEAAGMLLASVLAGSVDA
jgi:hypothetical protein